MKKLENLTAEQITVLKIGEWLENPMVTKEYFGKRMKMVEKIVAALCKETRCEALKEMDNAWTACFNSINPQRALYKLRSEYKRYEK